MKNYLLLGTRKGLIVYKYVDKSWEYSKTHFLGIPVSIVYADERTKTWWACLDHGHWGCKLHRSFDQGDNWEEVSAPIYPEGEEIKAGVAAATKYIWALAHGGKDRPNELYLGTEPGGLFFSNNNGNEFTLNQPLWQHPSRKDHWFGAGRDYPGIHSIVVDPRDSNHIFLGISVAGVFETTDGGKTWQGRNKGLIAEYLPDHHAEYGHDPHLLVACKAAPDVLWQQNHCGIFRSTDGAHSWQDISEKNGVANFGFAIAADEINPEKAWVVPGHSDEMRVAINEALCVSRTRDGGQSWQECREGLPQKACFDIIYRHALDVNKHWAAFGTTCGNLFISDDEGSSWEALNHYLPMIYSVNFEYS